MLTLFRDVLTNESLHKTLRTVIFALAAVIVARALFTHPPPSHSVTVAPTTDPKAVEAQAAVDAAKILAQVRGGAVPVTAQPAVAVVHDLAPGFSPAQINAILEATKPKTAPVLHVSANLVPPSPAPTPTPGVFTQEQISSMYQVAKSADIDAMNASKIKVDATLSQEEVPTSRLQAIFTPGGSGIGFDLARRKRFALVVGGIERGTHIAPLAGVHWEIPHTSLSAGPAVFYDRGWRVQVSVGTHF